MSKWMVLIRTALVSTIAASVNAPTSAKASLSSDAFDVAARENTLRAFEQFVEQFPDAPEAKLAMREILSLSRDGVLSTNGPTGLTVIATSRIPRIRPNPYQ